MLAVSIAIGIASHIQPVPPPVFPVAWVCKESIHESFISVDVRVLDKGPAFFVGRRDA
jgi:hypothetical protein